MEWVETVGITVEEARDAALDLLGVAEDEAEFEVLEEPKPGLFGRTRGSARIRARVRPTQPRPKVDRRGRRPRPPAASDSGEDSSSDLAMVEETPDQDAIEMSPGRVRRRGGGRRAGTARVVSSVEDTAGERIIESNKRERGQTHSATARSGGDNLGETGVDQRTRSEESMDNGNQDRDRIPVQTVADAATDFLAGLVEALGMQGEVTSRIEGDEIDLNIAGDQLGLLVGPRGSTLVALQELTRLASQRRLGDQDTRLRVDVAGYRERRREALSAFTLKMADEVVASGVARVLEPMSSPDRKVVHDTLNERDDVSTRSEGDDPFRRVVISPVE
jgi:spoIIIJ-associated protein